MPFFNAYLRQKFVLKIQSFAGLLRIESDVDHGWIFREEEMLENS